MLTHPNNFPLASDKADKRIAYTQEDLIINRDRFKYSLAIPKVDRTDFSRLNYQKYWWLTDTSAHMAELVARRDYLQDRRD